VLELLIVKHVYDEGVASFSLEHFFLLAQLKQILIDDLDILDWEIVDFSVCQIGLNLSIIAKKL